MKITCVGGGPGGLYAALLLKRSDPSREVTVIDRNPPDATYGWGVVFSDETLGFLEEADHESYDQITRNFVHWEAIDIHYRDQKVRSGGHAFSGLARRTLLAILQDRCRSEGVNLRYREEVLDPNGLDGADLVIAADGLNSRIRAAHADVFKPRMDIHATKYIWLGLPLRFEAFTFVFRMTPFGMFQVHAYPFTPDMSTFIVECTEPVWKAAGLDSASEEESIAFCSDLFADVIAGRPLLSNRSTWINFVTLRNQNWRCGNIVLLGDAAHTAHFSIGSGTKMAMEDAIALARAVNAHRDVRDALVEYEELREPVVERTQLAARDSSYWFENVRRYASFAPTQFAFSLLTRSKRITYDSLRLRDPELGRSVDAWFASQCSAQGTPGTFPAPPPLEVPLRLAGVMLPNRVTCSPGWGDAAIDGIPGDRHLVGAGAAAMAGVGLILAPEVAVSAEGRITPGSAGLYCDEQAGEWTRIVRFVRQTSSAAIGVQLVHAGTRGSTRPRCQGADLPLRGDGWPLVAASPIAYTPESPLPREADEEDMARVCEAFVAAAERARECGCDLLELHFGGGYLLGSFLSPLTNKRTDGYGGDLTARLRYPLQVLAAVRQVWPPQRPLSVCFTAAEWAPGGTSQAEALDMARWFGAGGATVLHVVSGGTVARANPPYGRMWEAPLGDLIRNEAPGPAVLLGGHITSADEVNTLLAAGRADLCLVEDVARVLVGRTLGASSSTMQQR